MQFLRCISRRGMAFLRAQQCCAPTVWYFIWVDGALRCDRIVTRYNRIVTRYNRIVARYNRIVTRYNRIVTRYNSIAGRCNSIADDATQLQTPNTK